MLIENWIFEKNLFSFIEIMAHLISYHLENEDIEAIKYNTKNTDYENGDWFEYEFNANANLGIAFSLEKDSTHIFIKIQLEHLSIELKNKIDFLFEICQYYLIKDENLNSWYEEL
jgi:hypothetical protein